MSVYKRVNRGVWYNRWDANDTDREEPVYEDKNAEVEEVYYDKYNGNLHVSILSDEENVYIEIPITANPTWNSFVNSLPTWDL